VLTQKLPRIRRYCGASVQHRRMQPAATSSGVWAPCAGVGSALHQTTSWRRCTCSRWAGLAG